MANIFQALNKTALVSGIKQAATGKAAVDTGVAKTSLGEAAIQEENRDSLQDQLGQAQLTAQQQAIELGGVEQDAKEKEADIARQKSSISQDLDYKLNSMYRKYAEAWDGLSQERKEAMMSTAILFDKIRNEEESAKIEMDAKSRQLEDANRFAIAQATAKYSEFIDLAKTDMRVRNYIYKNDLQSKEEFSRITGKDAFNIAIETMKTERIQASYDNMAKGIETLLPSAAKTAMPKKAQPKTDLNVGYQPFTSSAEVKK